MCIGIQLGGSAPIRSARRLAAIGRGKWLRCVENCGAKPVRRLTKSLGARKEMQGYARHVVACRGTAADERSHPLDEMLREYLPILVFLAVAIGLGLVLVLAAVVLAVRNPDPEKVSAYECGFNAFDDARMKFDVRFYLVSILFIIFDLEIAFLFPWAVAFQDMSMVGFWSMMVFLAVLTIGFAYEWKKGALEWQ